MIHGLPHFFDLWEHRRIGFDASECNAWKCNAWGHVSDVTLYTASQRHLRASLYSFALYCHIGNMTLMHYTPYVAPSYKNNHPPLLHMLKQRGMIL